MQIVFLVKIVKKPFQQQRAFFYDTTVDVKVFAASSLTILR